MVVGLKKLDLGKLFEKGGKFMKFNISKKKSAVALAVMVMLTTGGNAVFASNKSLAKQVAETQVSEKIETRGTIDKDAKDDGAINDLDEEIMKVDSEEFLKDLVNKKVITEKEAQKLKVTEKKANKVYEQMDKFFEDGKLSQSEKDEMDKLEKKAQAIFDENKTINNKINKFIGNQTGEKTEIAQAFSTGIETLDDMTKDAEIIKVDSAEFFKDLVTENVITQDEANKLKETEKKANKVFEQMDKLFEDGKLNQSEKDDLNKLEEKIKVIFDENKTINDKVNKFMESEFGEKTSTEVETEMGSTK